MEQSAPGVVQTPPTSPTPPITQKRSFALPILLITIGLLLTATAFLAYQNMQLQKQITEFKTVPLAPLETTATPDPTANSISATLHDLTFRYPNTWEKRLGEWGAILFTSNEAKEGELITLYTIDNPKNLSIPAFHAVAASEGPAPSYYSPKAKEKTVDGIAGYYTEDNGCEPTLCDTFAITRNKKIYVLTSVYAVLESQANPSQRAIFNQILSTFNFSDHIDIPCTSTNLNLTFPDIGSAWTCTIDNHGKEEVGWDGSMSLASSLFTVNISSLGRGTYCTAGQDPTYDCVETPFYTGTTFSLTRYTAQGADKELFGSYKIGRSPSISVIYKGMGTQQLTNAQKQELIRILNSAQPIK